LHQEAVSQLFSCSLVGSKVQAQGQGKGQRSDGRQNLKQYVVSGSWLEFLVLPSPQTPTVQWLNTSMTPLGLCCCLKMTAMMKAPSPTDLPDQHLEGCCQCCSVATETFRIQGRRHKRPTSIPQYSLCFYCQVLSSLTLSSSLSSSFSFLLSSEFPEVFHCPSSPVPSRSRVPARF